MLTTKTILNNCNESIAMLGKKLNIFARLYSQKGRRQSTGNDALKKPLLFRYTQAVPA